MKTTDWENIIKPGGQYTLFVASDMALRSLSRDHSVYQVAFDNFRGCLPVLQFFHHLVLYVTPDQMTDGMTLNKMNRDTMKLGRIGGRITLDDATVIKAVSTGNGMIYVMDRPPLKQR